jgi:hypothetical protein
MRILRASVAALLIISVANLALGHWAVGFSTLAVCIAVSSSTRRR